MSEPLPAKIEFIQFVCSACGKRSISMVLNERMRCEMCDERYGKDQHGQWFPVKYIEALKVNGVI